ncbi:MAG: hypothetical protein R3B84_16575 [Zavarzinella sp.]
MSLPPPLPEDSPVPPQLPGTHPADSREKAPSKRTPPKGRKFPCRQCGAKVDFDPAARGLKCPYCGFTEVIPDATDEEKAKILEHDLETFLQNNELKAHALIGGHSSQVKCTGCGAVVILEDRVATDHCPYCSTHLENRPEKVEHLIDPESVLPFQIARREAVEKFNRWLESLWFAPSALKKMAILDRFASIYTPYWTYDSMTYTRYTGERGDDYTTTEHYTDSSGKSQTRTVTHTRWSFASGNIEHFFDDVLIPAAETLPKHLVAKLSPWPLPDLQPYKDDFLSGHLAERYSVNLTEGLDRAKKVMHDAITGMINSDIGGDHQRIHSRHTDHIGVTFKHTLLPVWVANYKFHEKTYHLLVNGSTGKVAGDRPWSWLKILRLVLLILIVLAGLAYAYSKMK